MSNKQSNTDDLLLRISELRVAVDKARGKAKDLVQGAPLEIHLYNLTTRFKVELEGFDAMIRDFRGEYLKDGK